MKILSYYKIWALNLMFFIILIIITGLFLKFIGIVIIIDYRFIILNSSEINMLVIIDWISILFISLVLFISIQIVYYMESYIRDDKNGSRFIYLVLLFIFSMLLLIMRPNLIRILLGWDGLGLISFCLVIYYQNKKRFNSGMITILFNRLGDSLILLRIAWMFNFGGWNFINYRDVFFIDRRILLVIFLTIIAAITKRAQVPFSFWLPAAIAAPTPVSALVHSSTLVTAGVYLIIRFIDVLSQIGIISLLIIISLITIFISGLIANFENDLKKIIALSTLRQLGVIMCILRIGFGILRFLHLMVHALFKSILFICAGIMIHQMNNNQDVRLIGSLMESSPIIRINFCIGNLSLCGIPFLAGFYSKDVIMEIVLFNQWNFFFFFFFFFCLVFNVF